MSFAASSSVLLKLFIGFQTDILRYAALPLVISHECFQAAKSEFSFDMSEKEIVSAEEFRNFFVYCHTKPFDVLIEILGREFPEKTGQLSGRALVFSFFAPNEWTEVRTSHLETLKNELYVLLGGQESHVLSVTPFFCQSRLRFDFFVVLGEGLSESIAQKVKTNPIRLNDRVLKCSPYCGEELPRSEIKSELKGELVATGMAASGVVFLKKAAKSVSKFTYEVGANEKIRGLNESTKKIVEDIDKKTNISQLTKSLGDSTRMLVAKASMKVNEIDKDLDFSNKVSEKMKYVREKPCVQKGLSVVSSWYGAAKESISRFSNNTLELAERKLQNENDASERENFCVNCEETEPLCNFDKGEGERMEKSFIEKDEK